AALEAGDEAGAAEELQRFYDSREDVEYLEPGPAGAGDATADELAAGPSRFGDVTRASSGAAGQRIAVDWDDTWGGTEESPGTGQVRMADFVFMPTLTYAYVNESDPQVRARYAQAWMEISLDYFADNPSWPRGRNLSGAKRLPQLVQSF